MTANANDTMRHAMGLGVVAVLAVCLFVPGGRGIDSFCSQMDIPDSSFALTHGPGGTGYPFALGDICFVSNDATPIATTRDISFDGGATMPWELVETPCPTLGNTLVYVVTNGDLIAGQYVMVEASLTGGITETVSLVIYTIDLSLSIHVKVPAGDTPSGSVELFSGVPATITFPLWQQWQLNAFFIIPADVFLVAGTEISMAGFAFNNALPSFYHPMTDVYPSGGQLRISSHVLEYHSIVPTVTTSCTIAYDGLMTVSPNFAGPITVFPTIHSVLTSECREGTDFAIAVSIQDGHPEFEITVLRDDNNQYIVFDSTLYGFQDDTDANYIAQQIVLDVDTGGSTSREFCNLGVTQFFNNELSRTTSSCLVSAPVTQTAGNTITASIYASSQTGRKNVVLQEATGILPNSGFVFRITSYAYRVV